MIKYLIQTSSLSDSFLESYCHHFDKLNINPIGFGILPFTTEITGLDDLVIHEEDKLVLFGSTKLVEIIKKATSISELLPQANFSNELLSKFKRGIFHDKARFDQGYCIYQDLPMLNSDAEIYPLREALYQSFPEHMFVKPTDDLKYFNAGVIHAYETLNEYIHKTWHHVNYLDCNVLIASTKHIEIEYRFFVVGGKVISGSSYLEQGKHKQTLVTDKNVLAVAQTYANMYHPNDVAFGMDLAVVDGRYRIVEYNCFNYCGIYKTEYDKVLLSLADIL